MATSKIFSILQSPLLNPSTYWNFAQRNYMKERTLLKKMGYPEKPKRPPSGFVKYVAAQRPSVLAKNPKLSFTEVTSILSKQWKVLPGAEKEKYSDNFKKELAEYKVKMKEYNSCLTDKQREELKDLKTQYEASKKESLLMTRVRRMEKELKKPKNPVSSFVVFCSKNSDNFQELGAIERLKKCAEMWKTLSDAEKQKYKDLYNKEYEKYKKDLQNWEDQMMQQGNLDLVRLKTLQQKLNKSS